MKTKAKFTYPISIIFLLTACGSVNNANDHLASMDDTSKKMLTEIAESRKVLQAATDQAARMADALVAFQKMGIDLLSTFQKSAENTKPVKTENIDDILNQH